MICSLTGPYYQVFHQIISSLTGLSSEIISCFIGSWFLSRGSSRKYNWGTGHLTSSPMGLWQNSTPFWHTSHFCSLKIEKVMHIFLKSDISQISTIHFDGRRFNLYFRLKLYWEHTRNWILWLENMTWKAKRRLWQRFLQSECIPTAAFKHNSNFSLSLWGLYSTIILPPIYPLGQY